MKNLRARHTISALLLIFMMSLLTPSCAVSHTTMTPDASRRSLMMPSSPDRSNPKKVKRAKASRAYKKSKARSNYYKKRKHKYK